MSSKPSPAGARRVLALLDEIDTNARVIEEHRKSVEILRSAEQAADRLHRELADQLQGMDCASVGNAGFEGRIGWLLAEVVRLSRGGTP